MTEINWLSGIGEELDVNQSNKHFICKWFINSEDDDDLCLGNGSQKNKDAAIKLQELLLTQNPTQEKLDKNFKEYINLYNSADVLKLINIRTCGLERYLVYLNSNKVGIYVPTKEEEKNLEGKIHFPLYIHESMSTSGFEEAQKKFYEAIDSVRGQIIGIESNSRLKFKANDGDGIMFGQLLAEVDNDDIIFNLIGKFDEKTKILSKCESNSNSNKNKCDISILSEYFGTELNLERENGNKVYTSENKNLKIFPKEIYGNNIGIPNYDIKIPAEMRKNIKIFCGQDKLKEHESKMDKLRNDSANLGEKMNINIKKRRELINKVKGLKKDLYENMFLYDKEFEKLSKKKESEELDDDELQLFNALEELKTFDKNQDKMNGGTRKRRSRKNKRVEYRKMRRTRSRSTKRCGTRGKSKRVGRTNSKSRLRSRKNKKKSRRR